MLLHLLITTVTLVHDVTAREFVSSKACHRGDDILQTFVLHFLVNLLAQFNVGVVKLQQVSHD